MKNSKDFDLGLFTEEETKYWSHNHYPETVDINSISKRENRSFPISDEIASKNFVGRSSKNEEDKVEKACGLKENGVSSTVFELSPTRVTNEHSDDEPWLEDGSHYDISGENDEFESQREWRTMTDQFHTIGFREGVIAGQQAIAQEGFNLGFKQSVGAGFNWGIVRGASSAFLSLPKSVQEKLIEAETVRNKLQKLNEDTFLVSSTEAFKMYLISEEGNKQTMNKVYEGDAGKKVNGTDKYVLELESIVSESNAITFKLMPK